MKYSFKLLTFNTKDKYNKKIVNVDDENENENGNNGEKEFEIQMFGINEKGETASIFVTDYNPFFYIKVGDNWKKSNNSILKAQIRNEIDKKDKNNEDFIEDNITYFKMTQKKTLYGFDANKDHNFILIKFKTEAALKKAKKLWYCINKKGKYTCKLNKMGYQCCGCDTELYEANIPPLLRMFHIQSISPSGWIEFSQKNIILTSLKMTSCKYEYTINYKNIKPLTNKETSVPYKIASFDIEASSSHGDFPLAKKDYKKLATNIINTWDNEEHDKEDLKKMIYKAFNIEDNNYENIDTVYHKKKNLTRDNLDNIFEKWIKMNLSSNINLNENRNENENENEKYLYQEDEVENEGQREETIIEEVNYKFLFKNKKKLCNNVDGNVLDLLNNYLIDRDTKLTCLTKSFCPGKLFPQVEGDIVTFIGTTFIKYGETEPYLNHCIVKNECSDLPQIKNSKIEHYDNEKSVLLAWTKLIQEEDPDIIIGYNIFGFDYIFLYDRACELDCVNNFLKLSRNKNESCLSKKWIDGSEKIGIEENSLYIASGQHDIKYIKMNGRLQIDLYNYFRREYQLIKYKLDYVSSYFIGDYVKSIEHNEEENYTKIYSKNLIGLENNNFISFQEESHSVDQYKNGNKFEVFNINDKDNSFMINGIEKPNMNKKVKWGLVKDDVTPQDIFRMTNEGPKERALIAKYCIQDCNLVHHLMNKIDIITEYIEMANLCSVPIDFIVMRGQGIKLTSYIAKKCREKNTLMPVIDKLDSDDGYEGAIVLEPKCNLYLEEPVACVDYSSLYPSSMISENISHDSKVWTKEYDLNNNLIKETGEKDKSDNYKYDNLKDYKYVNITYDTYRWKRKNNNPKAAMEKVKIGYKICRFAQFLNGKLGIMPSILEELLAARKHTRKLIPLQKDDFMKNVLDKRQLSIKITANSMYGQTGAKTSSFYEKDCAASTTAIGRLLLTYAKKVIETSYKNRIVDTSKYGKVKTNGEYVYGDTDSVFFKFNLKDMNNKPIVGIKALEITIELAKQAGKLATKYLKKPHDLEYEKTFLPFCLLSKKRYVGMLYEEDIHKCKRKSMGIVLKRRDNAPIVKDIYGGIIDILMKDKNVKKAITFLKNCLQNIIDEKYEINKLIITKSLRGDYKNPDQIAHKVLADRIGKRDPGNKPNVGDRISYIYIYNSDKKALQGDKIETPDFIKSNNIKIDYSFYITNQIMKPVQQLLALVLEDLPKFKSERERFLNAELRKMRKKYTDDMNFRIKKEALRNKEVKKIIFDEYLIHSNNMKTGNQDILKFTNKGINKFF